MLIYSKNILLFLKGLTKTASNILENEMNLKSSSRGNKVYVHYKRHRYRLELVLFEGNTKLGYFNSHLYEIGFNKSLLYSVAPEALKDIIRHELAHFFHFLIKGESAHNQDFRLLCKSFGWDESVYLSKLSIDSVSAVSDLYQSEKIISRVQKLLRLAQSANVHEAEQAMVKANQLLLKHNLTLFENSSDDEDFDCCLERVLDASRGNTKTHVIQEILNYFFVKAVLNHGQGKVYLEVIGSKVNVEIAKYVASYLTEELESLWEFHKKEYKLKGLSAKNSFWRGVAIGFTTKMQNAQKNACEHISSKALQKMDHHLQVSVDMVYGKLRMSSSRYKHHDRASKLGNEAGRKLNINKAMAGGNKLKRLLTRS
ncbi:MAG: SprT-like domain-containing protein [Bacteriovoracia bacterium]